VGHSQGTIQAFAGASLIPDYYAAKVNLFVALAPVASLQNIDVEVFHKIAPFWREI
jgi:hypothetical protein